MQKTAKVLVERTKLHERTKQEYVHRAKFSVHDEEGLRLPGDIVRIENCAPISKTKRFKIIDVIKEAERYTNPDTGLVTTPFTDAIAGFPKNKGWKRMKKQK
jgi:small subunit ribosomal protein S17